VTSAQQPTRCNRCHAEATGLVLGPVVPGMARYVAHCCDECGPILDGLIRGIVAAELAAAQKRRPQA
jgi:hypothetical protein